VSDSTQNPGGISPDSGTATKAGGGRARALRPARGLPPGVWETWEDERLLDQRLCDLRLQLRHSPVEPLIRQVLKELRAKGLRFRPHFWIADDWFTPDGVPGVAIPFYVVHPRLARIEQSFMLEVEGGTPEWGLRILRHEVGHAIQDRNNDRALANRTRLVRISAITERIGVAAMIASPLCSAFGGPGLTLLVFLVGFLSVAGQAIVHLVTLPVEWDASFGKAMPILERGGYLPPDDLPQARRILTACALTYAAASLVGLLNVARWLRVLIR